MLIICSGADSYKALQKAKELEAAYKAKHDPSGLSIESCEPDQSPVQFLQERLGVGSLFAKRSFLRVSGLLRVKAADKKVLKKLFDHPDEMTIVVDVEEGSLKMSDLDSFSEASGIVRYDFPETKGAAFEKWLSDHAAFLGITDGKLIREIAQMYDGDSWGAISGLIQVSCGYPIALLKREADTTYQYIDSVLQQQKSRFQYDAYRQFDSSTLALIMQQASQAERVKNNDTAGIHPFVANKLKKIGDSSTRVLLTAIEAHALVRSGFATDTEANVLF